MRVVIADDAVLIRSGLATLLAESGIEPIGQAADGDELLRLVARTQPEAAIVDIRMPPTHTDEGLYAAQRIRREHPDVAVLLLSQYLDAGYALRLAEQNPAGVGYLLKDRIAHAATLADALHRLVAGECVVDPTIVSKLLARARVHNPLDDLTPREREVLSLMAEGRANPTIGRLLSLQPKTVETHVSRVFSKLRLVEETDGHRRVLAVLTYLRAESP